MAGASSALAVLAVAAVMATTCAAVAHAGIHSARATAAADAAALAAADTASGLVGGDPCSRAADLARIAGATLESCEIDGVSATVAVSAQVGVLRVHARARAGPPP